MMNNKKPLKQAEREEPNRGKAAMLKNFTAFTYSYYPPPAKAFKSKILSLNCCSDALKEDIQPVKCSQQTLATRLPFTIDKGRKKKLIQRKIILRLIILKSTKNTYILENILEDAYDHFEMRKPLES